MKNRLKRFLRDKASQARYAGLTLYGRFKSLREKQAGQSLIEYALLAALIALVVAAVLPNVATAITNVFNDIARRINPPAPGG